MEMRPVKLIILGTVCMIIAFVIPAVESYLFFTMAMIPLILLAIGQMVLPRSKRSVRVWFDPVIISLLEEDTFLESSIPVGRLSGKDLVYNYFKQWHDFEITTYRFWLLGGTGLVSLIAMYFSWQMKGSIFGALAFYYSLIPVWAVMVAMAKRWLWERRMLRLEGISMAPFSVSANGFYRQIKYHFVDPEGQYRGGWFESMICSRADSMTIIFYDETNPDRSVPASGLMFHRLIWKESHSSGIAVSEKSEAN